MKESKKKIEFLTQQWSELIKAIPEQKYSAVTPFEYEYGAATPPWKEPPEDKEGEPVSPTYTKPSPGKTVVKIRQICEECAGEDSVLLADLRAWLRDALAVFKDDCYHMVKVKDRTNFAYRIKVFESYFYNKTFNLNADGYSTPLTEILALTENLTTIDGAPDGDAENILRALEVMLKNHRKKVGNGTS